MDTMASPTKDLFGVTSCVIVSVLSDKHVLATVLPSIVVASGNAAEARNCNM